MPFLIETLKQMRQRNLAAKHKCYRELCNWKKILETA